MLIRIESSYFVAGVETNYSVVVRAAPIIKYMIGWHSSKVVSYCEKKKWSYQMLKGAKKDRRI